MKKSSTPRTSGLWFLPDEPVREIDRDAFGHSDIANNLLTMIREPRKGRLMIGLFGPFGVGKSTVIELLRQALAGDREQVLIRVSAERHEIENFHRSFTFSVAERLIEQGLADRSKVDNEIQTLEYASTQSWSDLTLSPFVRFARRAALAVRANALRRALLTITIVLALLAIVTLALVLGGFFGHESHAAVMGWVGSVTGILALAGTAPLVVTVWSAIGRVASESEALKPGVTTALRPRAEAADEYERTFARLTDLISKRLVIAVDDVDRMAASDILSALNAIRTFQLTVAPSKRPAFIVSVDERVVSQALINGNELPSVGEGTEKVVAEYLNRLFTLRQPMPQHVGGDLRIFAREVLHTDLHEGATKLGTDLDSVLNVLVHEGVRDPRHVLRLLNGFFGDYRLAHRREQQAQGRRSITKGFVTSNPVVLARMSVLRVDFPSFFEALVTETRLLGIVESLIRGDDPGYDQEDFHRRIGMDAESETFLALKRFVGRTATWASGVDDLLPFLYLGQTTLERTVGSGDARLARSLLANRQIAELHEFLDSARGADQRQEALLEFLVEATRLLEGLELNNAIEALVENADQVVALGPRLAAAVADALYRAPGASPDVNGLLTLLPQGLTELQQQTIARALMKPIAEQEEPWITSLLNRRTELVGFPQVASSVQRFLLDQLATLRDSSPLEVVERYLPHFDSSANADLADQILIALFAATQRGEDDISDESQSAVEAIGRHLETHQLSEDLKNAIQTVFASGTGTIAAGAAARIISTVQPESADQLAELGWAFIRGSMDTKTGVINEDFAHGDLEAGQYLLTEMIVKARRHTAGKRRLVAHLGQMLGSAISAWETTSAAVNSLVRVALKHNAEDFEPLVQPMLALWTSKGENLDSDELELMAAFLDHLDELPEPSVKAIESAFAAALAPTEADYRRAEAISLLPATLATKRGAEWTPPFIATAVAHLSNSRAATVAAGQVAVAVAVNGAPTEADADGLLSGLRSRVIPYGLTAEALEMLVSYPWPATKLTEVFALVETTLSAASETHLLQIFELLSMAPVGAVSDALAIRLAGDAARLSKITGSDGALLGNLFRHLSVAEAVKFALAIGQSCASSLAAYLATLSEADRHEFSRSAPVLIVSNRDDDRWAAELLSKVGSLEPQIVADAVQDMVIEQVLNEGDRFSSDDYALILASTGPDTHRAILDTLATAWERSANEVTASLPVLEAIASVPEFDLLVAPQAAAALRRWTRDHAAEETAVLLAKSISRGVVSRSQSLSVLGPRGPKAEPAKSSYRAVREQLKQAETLR